MRNPFARLAHRDASKPTLRERLNATKTKAKQVFAVNRALLLPASKPVPPMQAHERPAPDAKLIEAAAAISRLDTAIDAVLPDEYGHPDELPGYTALNEARDKVLWLLATTKPEGLDGLQAKARVLLSEPVGNDDEATRDLARSLAHDLLTWPQSLIRLADDAAPFSDLARACLWAAGQRVWIDETAKEGWSDERVEEECARVDAVISRAISEPSTGLQDVSAKAALALEDYGRFAAGPGSSLDDGKRIVITVLREAKALSSGPAALVVADPILAAIAETRRLYAAWTATNELPQPAGTIDPLPEQNAAAEAFHGHLRDVLLTMVPTTAAGCAALARFCVEFYAAEGFVIDEDAGNDQHLRVLDQIARSPLL